MGDIAIKYWRIQSQQKHQKAWQSDIIFQYDHYFMVASGLRKKGGEIRSDGKTQISQLRYR